MRIKILVLTLICFIFIYCGIPTAQQIKLYPESSEVRYGQMILTLQELGCIIKHTDKNSMIILAEMINLGKDPMGIMHTADPPLQISINVKKKMEKIQYLSQL